MRLVLTNAADLKFKQYLLYLGVSIFVTSLFWIGYSIYSAYHKDVKNPDVTALLTPLNPSLDETALTKLTDRYQPPANYPIQVVRDGVPGVILPPGGNSDRFVPVATPSAAVTATPIPTPVPTVSLVP